MVGMKLLAEKTIQFYDDFNSFQHWINDMVKAGLLDKAEFDGEFLALEGRCKVAALSKSEPLTILICLGFAFFGPYWAFLPDTPEAFKIVKKWWREKRKNERS